MRVRTNKEPYSDAHSSDVLDRRENSHRASWEASITLRTAPTGGVTKTG